MELHHQQKDFYVMSALSEKMTWKAGAKERRVIGLRTGNRCKRSSTFHSQGNLIKRTATTWNLLQDRVGEQFQSST
jgi:hypothetical protein